MNYRSSILAFVLFTSGGISGYSIEHLLTTDQQAVHQVSSQQQLSSKNLIRYSKEAAITPEQTSLNPFAVSQQATQPIQDPLIATTENSSYSPDSASGPENSQSNFENLLTELKLVSNWNELEQLHLSEFAQTETGYLDAIERSPHILSPLLTAYAELTNEAAKDLLGSVLSISGKPQIEQHALTELSYSDTDGQSQWASLLAATGVNSAASREALLLAMDAMSDAENIEKSLSAFSPDIVPRDEQAEVASRLEYYANHTDAGIRSAGIEALSNWVDKDNTLFIETALNDETESVRRSAIFASHIAGIKSDTIKSNLIRMLRDESQPFDLRLEVFDALSAYPLRGDEHSSYLEFSNLIRG